MSRDDANNATQLIKLLEKEEEGYEFLSPVDYKALGLDDYPLIIKTPMDLGTIKKKIKAQKYGSMDDVVSDLLLIWDNCKTYNMMDSPIVHQAEVMENKMKEHCKALGIEADFSKRIFNKRPRDEAAAEGVSEEGICFEEKVDLTEKFKKVSHEMLAYLVQVIEQDCKQAICEVEHEKLQIKVDALDKETFYKLNEAINNHLNIGPKGRINP